MGDDVVACQAFPREGDVAEGGQPLYFPAGPERTAGPMKDVRQPVPVIRRRTAAASGDGKVEEARGTGHLEIFLS